MHPISLRVTALLGALLTFAHAEHVALTVTSIADSGDGSLRGALAAATADNAISPGTNAYFITFDQSLSGSTITLTTGSLEITGLEVSVDASNHTNQIILDGNNASRILNITSNSAVTLSNITICNGSEIEASGGGIFAAGGQLTMTDCTVKECFATYNGGGAYFGNGVQASLNRCRIIGNRGDSFGGGIFFIGVSSATVTNTVIAGNRSQNGGGICNLNDDPSIINCSIQGNLGGGIRNEFSSSPDLRNTVVWGNRIGNGSGATAPQQIKNQTSTTPGPNPNIDFCLIEGASGSESFRDSNKVTWGPNNLNGTLSSSNPMFFKAALASSAPNSSVNLRFLTGSPLIDIGDNSVVPAGLDLASQARIQNSNVDVGAYEAGYTTFTHLHPTLPAAGDENGNGRSNFVEYAQGLDPTASDNLDGLPSFSFIGGDAFLDLSQRPNALDFTSTWVTSTEIGNWVPMVDGIHYHSASLTPISSDRQQISLTLIETDPHRLYRQGFTQVE